jgi:dimethylhistidine N-methyltransferase
MFESTQPMPDAVVSDISAVSASDEIIQGLSTHPAYISPKFFYDAHGSALFAQITSLPEYYPTRTENAIMAIQGNAIKREAGVVSSLIELGAGNCRKAQALCALLQPQRFVPLDISEEYLLEATSDFREKLPGLAVYPVACDLTQAIVLPAHIPPEGRLVFYPGSSIGNFDPAHAADLLRRVRDLLDDDGALLIGFDLVKQVDVLEAAYNDAAGVTAAFNLNMLQHVNAIIGSDFSDDDWRHVAFFNPVHSRIEMHLESVAETLVSWSDGERHFAAGERIHSENSYKYRTHDFVNLLAANGFSRSTVWTDAQGWFAIVLARP